MLQPSFEDIFDEQSAEALTSLGGQPTSVLLTGSQGMLGNSIAKALKFLQSRGDLGGTTLYLLSREWTPDARKNWKKHSKLYLVENSAVSTIQNKVEIVIHTASPSNITKISSYADLYQANVELLDQILSLNPKKIIYISSGEVYKNEIASEVTHFKDFVKSNKRDWYPIVKLETENRLKQLSIQGKADVSVLRLFHTFGPGVKRSDGRSFADILWGAGLNNQIRLHSPGEQVRSFLYLSDAVEGILEVAFGAKTRYFVANLGSDIPMSIREFADQVSSVTNAEIKLDLNKKFNHSPNDYLVPIIENIRSFGWTPKIETIVGIERTIKWIRSSSLL